MKNSLDLYLCSIVFPGIDEAIEYCINNSLNLEIGRFILPEIVDNTTDKDFKNIKDNINKSKLKNLILHGACFDMIPSSMDPKIVNVTRERLTQSLKIARFLGAKKLVFHTGYNCLIGMDNYINKFIEKQIKFWIEFIEENKIDDITIVLENTYEQDPIILKKIYDGVNSKYFKSCIDTGHVNAYSVYPLTYWLEILEDYLCHFHIHNNDGKRDLHLGILQGKIEFFDFFKQVINFNKPLSFTLEIFNEKDMLESLAFLKENFEVLFEN
jgi:sugar phosphate isomerase/epimerase